MIKRYLGWLAGLILMALIPGNPGKVSADLPVLTAVFWAKNTTTGSEWLNPVPAKDGDVIRYRLVITNAEGRSTANRVGIQITVPTPNLRLAEHPKSNVVASNGQARGVEAVTDVGGGNYGLEYIAGSARLTKSGITGNINPDSEAANLITQRVQIGDILAGEANRVTVEFDAKVVLASSPVKTTEPTISPEPTTTESIAVAEQAPETGLTDPIWLEAYKWGGLGLIGFGLKFTAGKLTGRIRIVG